MKPQIVAITIAVLALPVLGQDQPRTNTTPTVTLSAPVTQEATDSPLVRAAKSTGRLGKKPTNVITNDTLLRVGAHMSIATTQAPLPPPSPAPKATTPIIVAPPRQPDAKAKAEAEARHKQAIQAAAEINGDGDVEARHIDPAVQEHELQKATSPKPPQN